MGGIFLLGGESLTRSDFDCSENCYLVGGMNLWWGRGGGGGRQEFGGVGVYWGGFFLVLGMSKFSVSGGESPPPNPPSRENPKPCIEMVSKTSHTIHSC